MAGIGIQLEGRQLTEALRSLGRAADSPRGGMEALGAHFVFSTQRNFERETAPDGTRWPPLSPRTAAKRSGRGRRGFDNMLRVTTRLYRSINYEATDSTVEWGTNVQYGRIHQLGGNIDMPSRHGAVTLKKIRTKGGGFRSRFSRYGSKRSESRVVSIRGHQVRIPARPYLGISEADRQAVPEIIADYLRSEVGRS